MRFKTHAQVRDEAANFLLSVCSEFDDAKSLLEIERAHPKTKEEGEPAEEELVINFQKEPKKSQKQLLKLIQMLKTHIMPHDEFIEMVRRLNQSQAVIPQEASILTRIIGVD